jgi:hypothetical protein
MPAGAWHVREWRAAAGLDDVLVLADPGRELFVAIGALRPAPLWVLRPSVLYEGARELVHGRPPTQRRDSDVLQLGADLVLDAGAEVIYSHVARSASDRVGPDVLLRELARLAPSPAVS